MNSDIDHVVHQCAIHARSIMNSDIDRVVHQCATLQEHHEQGH